MFANVILTVLTVLLIALISVIWAWVGLKVFEALDLKDPVNTKQCILAFIIFGPIAVMWGIGVGFFAWLKKFYNS